jgi:UDP-N-acetylglucosamine 2-epimerase (non-hydrolysing)
VLAPHGQVANVDHCILDALREISKELPIVFPMHPRTCARVEEFGLNILLDGQGGNVRAMEPIGYLDFLHLTMNARLVLTDSGGLQEETTVLGVPCLTLRSNTERPITCTEGTNQVVGNSKIRILEAVRSVLDQPFPNSRVPEKWDGRAAERIVEVLLQH